jgi:hypothetical protein
MQPLRKRVRGMVRRARRSANWLRSLGALIDGNFSAVPGMGGQGDRRADGSDGGALSRSPASSADTSSLRQRRDSLRYTSGE